MRRSTTYAGVFIPYLIMSAAYFTGEIDFGSFNQSIFAFNNNKFKQVMSTLHVAVVA